MKLVFLHLSDMHFTEQCDSSHDLDCGVRNELLKDIRRMRSCFDQIAGIIISGDIAFSAKEKEYENANNWLERIQRVLGGKVPVFCVPGNHDFDRSIASKKKAVELMHSHLRSSQGEKINEALADFAKESPSVGLEDVFVEYNKFAKQYLCNTSYSKPTWKHQFELGEGYELQLVGVNSSLVSNSKDALGRMPIGECQLPTSEKENVVTLVVCHHPFEWWSDPKKLQRAFKDRATLFLFGHEHDSEAYAQNDNYIIYSGALHPSRKEGGWEPRYNWLTLSLQSSSDELNLEIEFYLRKWRNSTFDEDVERGDKGIVNYVKRLEDVQVHSSPQRYNLAKRSNVQDEEVLLASQQLIPFVGREKFIKYMQDLLAAKPKRRDDNFLWGAISAQGGAGKTRLLYHFVTEYCERWETKFISAKNFSTSCIQKRTKPTLLIIDNAIGQAKLVRSLLVDRSPCGNIPLRVVLIDRALDDIMMRTDIVGQSFFYGIDDRLRAAEDLFNSAPIVLTPVSKKELETIFESTVKYLTFGNESAEDVYSDALEYLVSDKNLYQPLFAILCGLQAVKLKDKYTPSSGRLDLITTYLDYAEKIPWRIEKSREGLYAGMLVCLATAFGGMKLSSKRVPDSELYQRSKSRAVSIVGTFENGMLKPLMPDLLGESFFLLFLRRGEHGGMNEYLEEQKWFSDHLWNMGDTEVAKENCQSFVAQTIVGLRREFEHEGQVGADSELESLWSGLIDFLNIYPETDEGIKNWFNAIARALSELATFSVLRCSKGLDLLQVLASNPKLMSCPDHVLQECSQQLGLVLSVLRYMFRCPNLGHLSDLYSFWNDYFKELLFRVDNVVEVCVVNRLDGILNEYLQENPDAELIVDCGICPASYAAFWGYNDILEVLLQAISPNYEAQYGHTLLHIASAQGQLETVELLLDQGANIDARTLILCTPLHHACIERQASVVKKLLERGAKVDSKDKHGSTPLYYASELGFVDIMKILVAAGANIDCKNNFGNPPLFGAINFKNLEAEEFLLRIGAKLPELMFGGTTELHQAVIYNDLKKIEKLVANGVDINLQSIHGETVLHFAAESREHMVDPLISLGADVHHRTSLGTTPLHWAVSGESKNAVLILLNSGANAQVVDFEGITPLSIAKALGNEELVDILLENITTASQMTN